MNNLKYRILIFGAGNAGENAYESFGNRSAIVGFVDNDKGKQGGIFCGLPVYSPSELNQLPFDCILIASCFAKEIYNQLIEDGIDPVKIKLSAASQFLSRYADWRFEHSERLLRFKNAHLEQDCFIIGNGPSLNKTDLTLLNNCYTFSLNKIYLLFERSSFRPTFHVSINKYVIEQSAEIFSEFDFPSFVSYEGGKNFIKEGEKLFFIHTSNTPTFSKDITKTVIEGGTVTYAAMQLAYYMGFNRVFLVGVDHSFASKGNANELQKMEGDDPNHFDPRYFANQQWQLPDLESSEMAYNFAKEAFEVEGREIWDATIGGKLDIFQKLSFEDAVKMAKPRVE